MTLIILINSGLVVLGQQEVLEISEEELDSTNFSTLLNAYNKVIRADKEEITLLKLDLLGPLLYSFANSEEGVDSVESNVLGLAFEKKFKPAWSWIVAGTIRANKNDITNIWLNGGARYYYNMKNRILKGKSANNFSANYFAATANVQIRPLNNDEQGSINILYGIQRRLGKYGFVDWNIGTENIFLPFKEKSVEIDLITQITIGIGISVK